MEKWLEAFAKGLLIQKTTEEGSKTEPASEEQIQAFKKAVEENLAYQGMYRQPGDTITYDYRRGTVRGRQNWQEVMHTESANGLLKCRSCRMAKAMCSLYRLLLPSR